MLVHGCSSARRRVRLQLCRNTNNSTSHNECKYQLMCDDFLGSDYGTVQRCSPVKQNNTIKK